MRRTVTLLVVAALLTSACGPLRRRDTPNAPSPTTVAVGQDLASFEPSTPPPATDEPPALVLTVTDQNDANPSGIPIQIDGPESKVVESDEKGQVRFSGPDGFYTFRVLEGCHDAVQVLGGGFAQVGVQRGANKQGNLPVQWHHRFGPAPPVTLSSNAWKVGTPVELRYTVIDRCRDAVAPGASFPTFRLETNDVVKAHREPVLTSDGQGHATITVVCTKAGKPSVVLVDSANAEDRFDALREAATFGPPPTCA